MTSSTENKLDAVIAAPETHIVLLENEQVRVLKVVIQPQHKEPFHTHEWPSVFIMQQPARIRYYDCEGNLAYETSENTESKRLDTEWFGPEELHAVENIDDHLYEAIRIELKTARSNKPPDYPCE